MSKASESRALASGEWNELWAKGAVAEEEKKSKRPHSVGEKHAYATRPGGIRWHSNTHLLDWGSPFGRLSCQEVKGPIQNARFCQSSSSHDIASLLHGLFSILHP